MPPLLLRLRPPLSLALLVIQSKILYLRFYSPRSFFFTSASRIFFFLSSFWWVEYFFSLFFFFPFFICKWDISSSFFYYISFSSFVALIFFLLSYFSVLFLFYLLVDYFLFSNSSSPLSSLFACRCSFSSILFSLRSFPFHLFTVFSLQSDAIYSIVSLHCKLIQ